VLVGREREREVIRGLVAAARVGESGSLVLVGEAGIGKSALLSDSVGTVSDAGMRLLRATGTESESEVPFGGLSQLFGPALEHLEGIPGPQADALGGALALRPAAGGDRFAIGAATLSLLSRLAEDQPLAVIVDDAHLLDRPSAQALCFAARRFTADPVVVLLAIRDAYPCAVAEADLPVLQLHGLSASAAGQLVARSGRRLDAGDVSRVYRLSGGNPLALLELADDIAVLDTLPLEAPVPLSASLARAFARRADHLSPPGRTALLVAAAGGTDLAEVARACEALGIDVSALDEAQQAGLLRIQDGRITFRHGLVRSGVYAEASPATRRFAHRALAAALPDTDVDRRAWHLGEATLGADERAAAALAAAADRARDRSAHAVAAAAYERAAGLSPDAGNRAVRLVAGAECAWDAGLAALAVSLLTRASALPQPRELTVRSAWLHGTVTARSGSLEEARDVLLAAAEEAQRADPDTAIAMLADVILVCFCLADTATVERVAASIDTLAPRAATRRARWLGEMAAGMAGVLTGHGGPERMRRAVQQVEPAGELARDPSLAPWLVAGTLFLRERETGRGMVQAVIDDLRRRTAIGGLPLLLFHLARDQATTDQWDLAEATYTEGIQLARETGHSTDLAACLAGLAWLEARLGREAACKAHTAEALAISGAQHIPLFQVWSVVALAELELGLGRAEVALTHLERMQTLLDDLRLVDVDLSPAPELVDALVRLGRHDEASEVATVHAARATAKGQPWSLARAARALLLTCPDEEVDGQAKRAMDLHERTPDAFELARTQLAWGMRLRRSRRRVDARPHLRAALAAFDELGAVPWADQAATELRATGATVQRHRLGGPGELTPQEHQVARLLADGRTTREAAAALFLSPKTVEYHLRHVYLKLGIQSRAELADSMSGSAGDA
jgi:DNA-binding CsgD family transcriptional regulator